MNTEKTHQNDTKHVNLNMYQIWGLQFLKETTNTNVSIGLDIILMLISVSHSYLYTGHLNDKDKQGNPTVELHQRSNALSRSVQIILFN